MKKLTLKKTTLSRLNESSLSKVYGGGNDDDTRDQAYDTRIIVCNATEQKECIRPDPQLTEFCVPTEACRR
jgi:hypothetical protein